MTDKYKLVGCSNCDSLKIVQDKPETTQCGRCGNRIKLKKAKKFFIDDDKEKVEQARAILLAKRAGQKDEIEELIESGELSGEMGRMFGDDEFLQKKGVSELVDESETEMSKNELRDAIRKFIRENSVQEDEVVANFPNQSEDDIRDIISRFVDHGEIMKKSDGTLRLV